MTPKEYITQYRYAVMKAKAAQDHLDDLRAMAERITPKYGGDGGGTHQSSDKLGAAVARIVDAEAVVDAQISLLIATAREVQNTIEAVEDETLRVLLYERYINGKTFEAIAVQMNYSYVHIVHRLHPKALESVKDVIECNT